jgi:acetyl-CoA decarbonylase/synthase complex subunit gamma
LGAPGVAAHLVKSNIRFTVLYGPVRASDLPGFLQAAYKATEEMRTVRFGLPDRVKLIPNDFLYGTRYLLGVMGLFAVLSGVSVEGFSIAQVIDRSGETARNVGFGYFSGIVLTPLLLPFIPGRAFALKGALMGLAVSILNLPMLLPGHTMMEVTAWILLLIGASSFLAMTFTGSSTYTSLSGVKKEMRIAVPLQISSVVFAAFLLILDSVNTI